MPDLDEIYAPVDEPAFYGRIDRSLSPRGPEMLLEMVAELGIGPTDVVLDAGARDGKHARQLAERLGCRAVAIDVVLSNLVRSSVPAARASIGALPLAGGCCALVWCRDMLVHVADLQAAMRECARVLVPGGHLLVHATFATDRLEPRERRFFVDALRLEDENLSAAHAEGAFRAAGLETVVRDEIASEWRERFEEDGAHTTSIQLLRIARMRRARRELVAEIGDVLYDVELADCLWGVYQMIGKLSGIAYLLRKP